MKTQAPVDKKSLQGRKFRFVVSSAEDAAKIIRERLGETARVLSVKQVNGKGLTRFLSSPQLEIIVTVPEEEDTAPVQEAAQLKAEPEVKAVERAEVKEKVPEPKKKASVPEFNRNRDQGTFRVESVLDSAGFDSTLIQGIKSRTDWKEVEGMPMSHALVEVSQWFRDEYQAVNEAELKDKVAFFGAPAVGTSAAMCKYMAQEVFINNKEMRVHKMEGDVPNSDDALKVFCDVIGVQILKDEESITKEGDSSVLCIDCPGAGLQDRAQWAKLKLKLDSLGIESRVMVINAAYDKDLIGDSFNRAKEMGATHVVLTHMDEVRNYGKIWPCILGAKLPVLFLSCGQDVTGDVVKNVEEHLVHGTFPSEILN